VTIGILITPEVKKRIAFLDDPAIQFREVNKTCERCPVTDCVERAAEPKVVNRRETLKGIQARLQELEGSAH